jgi:hypothetical protein
MNRVSFLILALATFLLTLSPLAANAVDRSRSDDVFLSRPGILPSANQANGTGAKMSGDGQMQGGLFRCGEFVGDVAQNCAAETNNENKRASYEAGLHAWARNPVARLIVVSLLFAFLGFIVDIAAMPPFQGFVAEEVISSCKTTWIAILILAMLGGALLLPAAADIARESMTRVNHLEGGKGGM